MVKINWIKVIGTVLSVAGMIVTGVATTKSNNQLIEKLVDSHFEE